MHKEPAFLAKMHLHVFPLDFLGLLEIETFAQRLTGSS